MNKDPGDQAIDIVAIGYHQPNDCMQFWNALMACKDEVPWTAWYISVEATAHDRAVGHQLWGDRHLAVDENLGHARACNLGATLGDNDTLFFCNADTQLKTGVMDQLYDTLWSDESYGCIGPRQVDSSGRVTAAGIFGTHGQPKHRGWHERTDDYQDLRDDAIMASGSLYMIKRHVWDELTNCLIYTLAEAAITNEVPNGAMPAVNHYYSDTWPSYHMAAHGYKNVYEGRVTAIHEWHKASPVGSWADQQMPKDKDHFRKLCQAHGLDHD